MKKRDLLLAGLFLCTISAYGQPGTTEPVRYADDAKQIFTQTFEGSSSWSTIQLNHDPNRPTKLFTWQAQPVDTITEITYYKYLGTKAPTENEDVTLSDPTKFYGVADWEIAGVRTDSTIYMYNGVMRTDAVQPDDSIMDLFDSHAIKDHTAATTTNTNTGLMRFGEDGGAKYFSYKSGQSRGDNGKQVANTSAGENKGGKTPEYRRNLFVRLRDGIIQPETSYRVTVFVKGEPYGTVQPNIGLDLMRGYFHSEKSFIQSLTKQKVRVTYGSWSFDQDSYVTFSDKTDYDINVGSEAGKWQKITLMSYYCNDSVGNASPYLLGYYWDEDWQWTTKINKATGLVDPAGDTTVVLRYIQQPDKYFVRMAFRSDSTEFSVDNLSLTKSWIGGVEHHNDMIRVDFGYQTNLGDLAEAAREANKIAAVELPGTYFVVWAQFEDPANHELYWEKMPILSAEYHGDGYMYMWTEEYSAAEGGGMRSFEGAKQVLVSFTNPDDPALKLVYKGSYFPKGMDADWIAAGKKVSDFHNEISSLNPTIDYSPKDGSKVLSLKNLPPVIQRMPYEDGTFGLDGSMREFTFKFSKHLVWDNKPAGTTDLSFIKVVHGSDVEYWEFKPYKTDAEGNEDKTDTNTVIVRPAKYTADLSGDYTITIDQITHLEDALTSNSDFYGDDVVLNLHFGDFNVNAIPSVITFSNWRADIEEYNGDNKRPIPTSVYLHSGTDAFQKGTGVQGSNKCGFYNAVDDTLTINGTKVPDNGMFYLSNRTSGITGNLYSIVNLNKGQYVISFKFAGHSATSIPMGLKFYAKPTGTLEDGNDKGFATLEGVANKTVLEAGRTPKVDQGGSYGLTKGWKDGVETVSYNFTVPANGDYVFEWVASGSGDYKGFCISNYWITTGGDLSFGPVANINMAIADAAKAIGKADAAPKYKGSAYEALKNVKTTADGFIAAKKATKLNVPSEYDAEVKVINKAVTAQQSRVTLIDDFFKTLADAQAKVDIYKTADSLAAYKNLPDVQALQDLHDSYATFDYASNNDAAITTEKNKVNAAIQGIDNRVALSLVYPQAIAYAEYMKDTAVVLGIDVTDLNAAITAAKAEDDGQFTYGQLREKMSELTDLAFATVYKDTLAKVSTRRIQELDALAKSLGVTYPEGVAARIAAVQSDDDELAEIIKCAIKVAIYDKIVKGETVENVDLTPFIKNYYLYVTVKGIVDNTGLQLPGDRNNAAAQALQGAAQIQKIKHEWGKDYNDSKKIWVLILNQEYSDLFPGWTVKSFVTGNHSMVMPDHSFAYNDADVEQLVDARLRNVPVGNHGTVFDGMIGMDWNSKAELKQTITGLPAGIYTLGATITKDGNNAAPNSANLTIVSDVQTYTKDIKTDKKSDNFYVLEQKIDVDYVIETGSGGAKTDDFTLTFVGKNDDPWFYEANNYYATLLANAQSELDNLVTIVDKAKAVAAGVEYFTISGIKLDAPKAGEILIRKTTNGNGKVVVDKVIIK